MKCCNVFTTNTNVQFQKLMKSVNPRQKHPNLRMAAYWGRNRKEAQRNENDPGTPNAEVTAKTNKQKKKNYKALQRLSPAPCEKLLQVPVESSRSRAYL